MLRPPRRIRVSEGVQASLQIANPSGSFGNWSPEVSPYMVKPLDLSDSRLYEAVIFVGPARSGKTVALIDGRLAYTVTCNPADTLIIQTSQAQAEDFSKTRITRAIRSSPELQSRLSPRAHDDNVLLKFFRSGMSLRFGWPSLSVLSGKDIHDVLMTDVDNFTGDLTIDEAFGYALKRIQTYMSAGILIAESSPAKDVLDAKWRAQTPHEAPPAKGIAALYNRGDRHRWYWPCPACKEYFQAAPGVDDFHLPPFDELIQRVKTDDTLALARRYSILFCSRCHEGIEHKWKKSMNAAGEWVGDGQQIHSDRSLTGAKIVSKTASFWLGGVAAAYQSWESLVERYLQALKTFALTGEERALKATTNVDQAACYVPRAIISRRSTTEIQERLEEWVRGTVPEGVRFLTAAVDVQSNRFVVEVFGWGIGLEGWLIDRFTISTSKRKEGDGFAALDPAAYLEDWDVLIDQVIDRTYDGLQSKLVTCDSGGKAGVTARAYSFFRQLRKKHKHRRFRLIKGSSRLDAPTINLTMPDATDRKDRKSGGRGDVPVWVINTNVLKDAVVGDLARTEIGPGFVHLARWLLDEDGFFDEYEAESRTDKGWQNPTKARNEAFDLHVYNRAACKILKADKINWQSPPSWARRLEKKPADGAAAPTVVTEQAQPAAPPRVNPSRRPSGWMNNRKGWMKR
jgi:phage terminase large subunit GpA-like protein